MDEISSKQYAEKRYDKFLKSCTSDESLKYLQHCSQLIHLLPRKKVRKIVRVASKNSDHRVKKEAEYLVMRRIAQSICKFRFLGLILFITLIIFSIMGLILKWPFEFIFCGSYHFKFLDSAYAYLKLCRY